MASDTTAPQANNQPEISRHATNIASEPTGAEVKTNGSPSASRSAGVSIQPLEPVQTAQQPSVQAQDEVAASADDAEQKDQLPREQPTSAYEASDSLPDVSKTLTTEATDAMQSPRIYDTKEYIVPIKDTVHSHGTMGTIIAGIISAIVVVGGIVIAAYIFV